MDIKWQPVLQTPPFPEYTSGHAVISNAQPKFLPICLGDHFSYTDIPKYHSEAASGHLNLFAKLRRKLLSPAFTAASTTWKALKTATSRKARSSKYHLQKLKRQAFCPQRIDFSVVSTTF